MLVPWCRDFFLNQKIVAEVRSEVAIHATSVPICWFYGSPPSVPLALTSRKSRLAEAQDCLPSTATVGVRPQLLYRSSPVTVTDEPRQGPEQHPQRHLHPTSRISSPQPGFDRYGQRRRFASHCIIICKWYFANIQICFSSCS